MLAALPVWKVNKKTEVAPQRHFGLSGALKIRGVPFLLIGFFAYCALESTAMNWASTYFAEVKGISAEQAAQFASFFYIGITAGRFLSGFISDRVGDRRMIIAGTIVLACGIILLFIPGPSALSFTGFIVTGLGCAPIYHSRQLRRRKLGLGNRNTDGRRIYRFNIRSAAVRTARKTARLQHSAGIPDYFCGFDDNDDRTYVPHGGEGKRTGKHLRPNLKKYALTSDVKITEAGICMPASAFTLQ